MTASDTIRMLEALTRIADSVESITVAIGALTMALIITVIGYAFYRSSDY